MRITLLGAALGMGLFASPVRAQNDCLKQLVWPSVGRWAEYRTTVNQKQTRIRYAAVGTEKREGVPLKWIEMQTTIGTGPTSIYQMLLPGGPADIPDVREVIIKSGSRPPIKMDGMMLGMLKKQLEDNSIFSTLCDGVVVVGEESVRVSAGSYKAVRFHNEKYGSDTWISSRVPFSLVKSVTPRLQIELVASGDGAKSSITDTPKARVPSGP